MMFSMTPTARTNGRHLFNQMSRDVDRLFNQALTPVCRAMPVDIREEGDTLVLEAEVPGARQEDLNISVENGTLTITVERNSASNGRSHNGGQAAGVTDEQAAGGTYFLRERRPGNASRTFRLPETANLDAIDAQLAAGVLTLRIPKKEEAKPRRIPVK